MSFEDEPDCCIACCWCGEEQCLGDPVDDWDSDIKVGDEFQCPLCEGHMTITSVYPWKVAMRPVEPKERKDWSVS